MGKLFLSRSFFILLCFNTISFFASSLEATLLVKTTALNEIKEIQKFHFGEIHYGCREYRIDNKLEHRKINFFYDEEKKLNNCPINRSGKIGIYRFIGGANTVFWVVITKVGGEYWQFIPRVTSNTKVKVSHTGVKTLLSSTGEVVLFIGGKLIVTSNRELSLIPTLKTPYIINIIY